MKKFLALALALCMVFALAACTKTEVPVTKETTPTESTPVETPTKEAVDYKANLVEKGKLTIGTTGASAPFTYYDKNNNLVGYDIDVGNKLAKDLGLEPNFVVLDWAGLLPGLQSGRFDLVLSGVTITNERLAATGMILSQPYTVNGVVILKKKGNTEINGWDDIKGKVLGIVAGSTEAKMAIEKLPEGTVTEKKEYPGWTEMLLDLESGRIDYSIMDYLGPNYMMQSGDANIEVINDPIVLMTQGVATYSGEPELAAKVDELIGQYKESGLLEEYITRNFGGFLSWDLLKTKEIAR